MARGDQIYIFREFWNLEGLYEHHGIDCGDGTVIHYRKPSEIIERTSIEIFSRGQKIYIRQYPIRYIADIDTLSEPLKQAFMGSQPQDAKRLLNQALGEIRVAWDDVHPQYKKALDEMNSWHQVAMEALKRNREDLAKEAIKRKLNSKKRATELEENLEKLATMTQNLLKNQADNG